jgi:hypothetical protein
VQDISNTALQGTKPRGPSCVLQDAVMSPVMRQHGRQTVSHHSPASDSPTFLLPPSFGDRKINLADASAAISDIVGTFHKTDLF